MKVINIVICLMLNKICCIILYRILDNTIILSIDSLSKIYHILLKPAFNYNYYAGIKTYSEFVIVGQFRHMSKSRIENLKQSFILVFWKNKLK